MKLKRLSVNEIRGVKKLEINSDGKNIAIVGHNGTGKSAVIDALDFLFTGNIQRLSGDGTGGISVSKHGSHIDADRKDAWVEAVVLVDDSTEVQLTRSMAKPKHLDISGGKGDFEEKTLPLLVQGHQLLTRKEILRFITSKPRDRAKDIQTLLNISEIEKVRSALVTNSNNVHKELDALKKELKKKQNVVISTANVPEYDDDQLLEVVNNNRAVFSGDPIVELSSDKLQEGISQPFVSQSEEKIPRAVTLLDKDIEIAKNLISKERIDQRKETDKKVRDTLEELKSDEAYLRDFRRLRLYKVGKPLIEEDGSCPLCESEFEPGELDAHIDKHIESAKQAQSFDKDLNENLTMLTQDYDQLIPAIGNLIKVCKLLESDETESTLKEWEKALEGFIDGSVKNKLQFSKKYKSADVVTMFAPAKAEKLLSGLETKKAEKFPKAPPEQVSWEMLVRLGENLKQIEETKNDIVRMEQKFEMAKALLAVFTKSRDKVLNSLYDQVKDRFVDFYKILHSEDEGGFWAELSHADAGVNLEVDFYGRGVNPPHALHSEGHQDSMGICLYLALLEELTKGVIDLVMLDDVVMSVDIAHRRKLCKLINEEFADRQFLITTHEEAWAKQLWTEGVITNKDRIQFFDWDIDHGPRVIMESDVWKKIDDALDKEDIREAAGLLRHSSEHFYSASSDMLQAKVTYKASGRYDLGVFLPAAYSRLIDLLKKGKSTEHSWGNKEKVKDLEALEVELREAYKKTSAEYWAVNEGIHYTAWGDLHKHDFVPVVEAFRTLYDLFQCPECSGIVKIVESKSKPVAVQCNCQNINWRIVKKDD